MDKITPLSKDPEGIKKRMRKERVKRNLSGAFCSEWTPNDYMRAYGQKEYKKFLKERKNERVQKRVSGSRRQVRVWR